MFILRLVDFPQPESTSLIRRVATTTVGQRGSLQIGNPSPGSFVANLPGVFVANPNAGQVGALPFIFHGSGQPPGVATSHKEHCQRDEYPFFSFMGIGNNYFQWIRFLSSIENQLGGTLAQAPGNQGVCLKVAPSTVSSRTDVVLGPDGLVTCEEYTTTMTTRSRLRLEPSNLPNLLNGAGLEDNSCTPLLVQDGGFALLTDDSYFARNGLGPPNWSTEPHANQVAGRVKPIPNGGFLPKKPSPAVPAPPPPLVVPSAPAPNPHAPPPRAPLGPHPQLNKRAMLGRRMLDMVQELDADEAATAAAALGLVVDEGNSTRRPTAEELRDEYGLFRCSSEHCVDELALLGRDIHGRKTVPAPAEATAAFPTHQGLDRQPTALPVVPEIVATATAAPSSLDGEQDELRRAVSLRRGRAEMRMRREMPTTTPAPSFDEWEDSA